jgi:hypothetical protein
MSEVPWDSIIAGCLSADPRVRSEAESVIRTFRESSFEDYLRSILAFLDHCDSATLISYGLSLILSELRSGGTIASPAFDPFWHAFLDFLARHPPSDSSTHHFSSQILSCLASSTETIDVVSFLLPRTLRFRFFQQ